jgi:hypothetical protein
VDTLTNLAGPAQRRDRNRSRLIAWLIVAVIAITLLPPTVSAAPLQAGTLVEQATVWRVQNYRTADGNDYCTITVAVSSSKPHIRYLTWVYGTSCTAYRQGAAITLVYNVTYDSRGRQTAKTLRTWY